VHNEGWEPAVQTVPIDSRTNLIVMRLLSFLMDRIDPTVIPELFDFYRRIGWLGKAAAEYLSAVSEGTKPEALPEEEAFAEEDLEDHNLVIKKGPEPDEEEVEVEEADWRLTPEDHIKCWMFMMEIAGVDIDKNTWCEVEERIGRFERELSDYYRM
jgi:archaellum component FlaD/FlaE